MGSQKCKEINDNLQDIIAEAINSLQESVVLPIDCKQQDVRSAIRIYMRRHPEVFWFSHQYRFD